MPNKNSAITRTSEASHSLDVSGLPIEALRGILDKLNEKSQSVTRLFQKGYRIEVSDIRQLIEKVGQEFHACTIISRSATVSLTLSKNERYDFRTWSEFEKFDTSQASQTTSVQTEITYDVVRNADETPERYIVQVSVQNLDHGMGFFIGPIALMNAGEFPAPPAPLAANITYNNYILGKNLIATLDAWEKSLEVIENGTIAFLQKHSAKLSRIIFFLANLSGIAFSSGLATSMALSFQDWLIYSAASILTFSFAGREIGSFVERNIDRHTIGNTISLTRGDSNQDKKIGKRNKHTAMKAAAGVVLFVLQLILGVWAVDLIPPLTQFFGN